MDELYFGKGSVPVVVAARVYGKSPTWIRAGLTLGWLPIGYATRNGQKVNTLQMGGRTNFYISPKRLYEETGYVWKGERHG